MALNNALLNIGANAMATAAAKLSLHTAAPDATGSNLSTAAKVAAGWPAASGSGDLTVTNKAFTGGAPSGPCTHVGFWSSDEATFYGAYPLAGDQTFNAAGQYTLSSVTLDGSST